MVIEDTTGHAKIFLFGGVAEQVVRRTAAELVEESSSNQILLPTPLRGLVGRRYVFQVVISEQTFRTGQLCFQARRVFVAPTVLGNQLSGSNAIVHDPPGVSSWLANSKPLEAPTVKSVTWAASDTSPKGTEDYGSSLAEASIDPEGDCTTPVVARPLGTGRNTSPKGKEVLASANNESGYVPLSSVQCFPTHTCCAYLIPCLTTYKPYK